MTASTCRQTHTHKWVTVHILTEGPTEQRIFAIVAQWSPTLCSAMHYSPPDSPVYQLFQARILEWVSILFFRDLRNTGIEPTSLMSPALAGRFFTTSATSFPVFTLKLSDLKQQSCNISLVPEDCLGVALGSVQLGQFCSICLSSFSGRWISKTYPCRNG